MSELQLDGLRKVYGGTVAVEHLDLTVADGELVAFLGPSGCGKTTTLRMVAGFVTPTSGSVIVARRDITGLPADKRDMGMVFQSYALFPHMTVAENVAFGLRARHVPRAEIAGRVMDALRLVGLEGLEGRFPKALSGGQQQRVALARVLVLEPQLLLFDEPLSNLDAKLRVHMRHEIRRLQKGVGITALFVTHDQEEAMTIADRIVVMNHGRIEQAGAPAEIYDHPKTRFVADFIGAANLIEGAVEDGAFRSAKGLAVPLPPGPVPANGSGIFLSIRPEKIELAPPGADGVIEGTVGRATKLGGIMEYLVVLASGDTVLVHRQDRSPGEQRRENDRIGLVWRPDDARLLPA